jgi:hypothetical protein
MFIDSQVAFAMLSLCYAQQPSYLQHIVFPSLGILQHYTKFDACTITMLENLLGLGSFGTTMDHLACRQVTLPTSSGGLGLPLMVRHVSSRLFKMLGFDHSYTNLSFPTR